jgi:DNA polymerase III delta prime subunit
LSSGLREQFAWVEKYQPKAIAECILPERLKAMFQAYVDQGDIPNLLLTGSPGTGKTTVAKAMCHQLGMDVLLINASDENGIDVLRTKIKAFAGTMSFTGLRKCVILDEADALTAATQSALRAFMTEFARNCTFILTCNYHAKLIEPLHSRCSVVHFHFEKKELPRIAGDFMTCLTQILDAEGVEHDAATLNEVIRRYFPDFRRTINALQGSAVDGKLSIKVLGKTPDELYEELWTALRDKDFQLARKWVAQHEDLDVVDTVRKIYEWAVKTAKKSCLPNVVVTLGTYLDRLVNSADRHITLTACMVELMNDLEF